MNGWLLPQKIPEEIVTRKKSLDCTYKFTYVNCIHISYTFFLSDILDL